MTQPPSDPLANSIPTFPSPKIFILLAFSFLLASLTLATWLETEAITIQFITPQSWLMLVGWLGANIETSPDGSSFVTLGLPTSLLLTLMTSISLVVIGWLGSLLTNQPLTLTALIRQLPALTPWTFLPGTWFLFWIIATLSNSSWLQQFLITIPPFVMAFTLAGLVATLWQPLCPESRSTPRLFLGIPIFLWSCMALYLVISTFMNWGLYFNLQTPHGDTAMYEEHLWNLLHGKGFRSYLDQGLFLGEHIQVIHLFLIPIYLIYPSHLTLELCGSMALASGAIPIYWMAKRHSPSPAAATMLAVCYLLYFPMHFLDIAVDLKSFRPISLGIPTLLFALDQLERRHLLPFFALLLLTLAAKEDFAIIVSSLGLWMILESLWSRFVARRPSSPPLPSRSLLLGVGLVILGALYLKWALATIVWFRSGVEVHYAGYFTRFGNSSSAIIWTMLTDPLRVFSELATLNTFLYAALLLVPLGALPLFSPRRLLASTPLFVLLCLNEVASDPRHHFHAPIIPLLFWAAADGLTNLAQLHSKFTRSTRPIDISYRWSSRFAALAACGGALCYSLSPLGLVFWDPYSQWNWKQLYLPGERAAQFAKIEHLIPHDANVASTDYIHPRFTHVHRSYDYSQYARKVAGDTTHVPHDTDYIVIDTQHPYSDIKSPEQIPEYRDQPAQWQLIDTPASEYFIILKRRSR